MCINDVLITGKGVIVDPLVFRFSFLSIPFQNKFYHEFRFNKLKNAILN